MESGEAIAEIIADQNEVLQIGVVVLDSFSSNTDIIAIPKFSVGLLRVYSSV